MASHDNGWDVFREELRFWMERRRMTSRALAERLNALIPAEEELRIDEHIVKRWRHSTAPPLLAVRHIAAILEISADRSGDAPHDPTYLLRRMGLLAEGVEQTELFDATFRLQELRLRLMDVRASLGQHTARSGAGYLMQLGMKHGYAAAAYPVWEGPAGYPMHVADRLDFKHTSAAQLPLEANQDIQQALTENFVVPGSRMPRFSAAREDLKEQSHWAIPLIGRPFTHAGPALHFTAPSVTVSATTTSAWADDVGAMLAWLLGYGFVSTREITRELTSNPFTAEPLRDEVHSQLLGTAPQHQVWAHHSILPPKANRYSPWLNPQGDVDPGLVHIRLVEDDALLDFTGEWIARVLGTSVTDGLRQAKAGRDEAVTRLADIDAIKPRVLLIPVTRKNSPEQRWEQALNCVLLAAQHIYDLGLRTDLISIHERIIREEPDIAPNMLRWLADRGCPLVHSKFSTLNQK